VVIPAEIRKDAGIKPSTKFLVFNEGGNILLKMIKKETLVRDIHLIETIEKSEERIKEGQSVKADTSMSDEEIDDLLMHWKMEIIFSNEFKKEFKKIKDKTTRLKIIKQLKKLSKSPEVGKPLKYNLKNHRSIRIVPYRIIYRFDKKGLIINCFDHRKDVYN